MRTQVTPITVLYNESSALLSQNHNAASRFPLFNQIDSSLYRERLNHFPALPMSRDELSIPSQLRKTIAGCDFHMFSSTNNDIVIFSTEENIRRLSTKSRWGADGTFKSVPNIYYTQIFTIHVQLLGLSTIYIHHEGHRMYIRKLLAIAFIPILSLIHSIT